MYDVALSVLACVRAETKVHVAWLADEPTQAVALTPGGGRIGSLLGGALDSAIADAESTVGASGGVVTITVGPAEALVGGLQEGSAIRIGLAPANAIPVDIWEALTERQPVAFAFHLDGSSMDHFERYDGDSSLPDGGDWLVCSLAPTPRALIVGGGPIADALAATFLLVGWDPVIAPGPGQAGGLAPTLAPLDAAIVMGHDVETSGKSLQAAIASHAGYIGSIGSPAMQDMRREWLAYRGVSWDPRIHGPAGLPIGATNPEEIALSIVAEVVASTHLNELPID